MVVVEQGRAALVIIVKHQHKFSSVVYGWHIMYRNQSSANGKESECWKMKRRMPRMDILLFEMLHLFLFIFPYWYHEKKDNNNNNNNNFQPWFTKANTTLHMKNK